MPVSFEQFQASGRDVADLRDVPECDYYSDVPQPGRAYLSGLHIERHETGYCLVIGNVQECGDLTTLERELYDFGLSEGHFA